MPRNNVQRYRESLMMSKAELARIVGSDWNVVRAQLRNLEAHGLIRFGSDGIHTVIPDE